ncbi:LamG-like jellyroll fold domain-containing protein [Parapedobacter deserti]|uniref:LamG-like jellyroll fold domain-containing protein n=1 Tax=Parapedobacter deserti TaxID=1912957 RepID=A0ABV7JID6_9SPHI
MKKLLNFFCGITVAVGALLLWCSPGPAQGQTLAFPGAEGFGRYATGARGHANPQVYVVTNLNDSGPGSLRDALSQPGRFVVFAVGGVIALQSRLVIPSNTTIAGQTAPGDGIVVYGRGISYSGANNVITRFMRFRCGVNGGAGRSEDALGIANGHDLIFDHLSVSWGIDEVFSINWDNRGTDPDNITIQNSIIGQGVHRHNHSAGGLMEPGGKVSILRSLYHSNKTRNPKVKGINEFVNNVVYNFGNVGNTYGHSVSGDGYIMGGSASTSHVNIVNNYFIAGPHTPPRNTPFSRGTPTFNLYASGNYWDDNKDGALNGSLIPEDDSGYPGVEPGNFHAQPYEYPYTPNALTAQQAYDWVVANVGANFPRRDQVDELIIAELASVGTEAVYVYREDDLPLANGGLGVVDGAPARLDTDGDGIPDEWEDANGLDKHDPADALAESNIDPNYLNIEVYINSLVDGEAPDFIRPPSQIVMAAESEEDPVRSTITLTWSDNGNEAGIVVIERSADGEAYTEVAAVAVGTETYVDKEGTLPNTTYYYRLKIVTDNDESSSYVFRSITTPPIPTAPETPSRPMPGDSYGYVSIDATGQASVRWSGSENTDTYVVFLGTSAASLAQVAEVPAASGPTAVLEGLEHGQTYFWRVDAVNDRGTATGAVWSFRVAPEFERGLVGHWAFDEEEGPELLDASSYETHGLLGTDDAGQVRISGIKGGAVDLATVDRNMYPISIPHADHLYLGQGSFSISFWMKGSTTDLPPDNNSSAYLLCKGSITRNENTGATGKRFNIELKNNQFRFAIDDDNDAGGGGKDEVGIDGRPFFVDDWVHVVVIRDAEARQLRVYRNGEVVGQTAIQRALSGIGEASDLVIGNIGALEFLSSQHASAPYTGQLDELRLFNHVLSEQEIMEEFARAAGLQQAHTPVPAHGQRGPEANRAEVTWAGGALAEIFLVYFGASEDALEQVAELPATTMSYVFEGLQAESAYFWRVDARAGEDVAEGDTWSFQTAAPPPESRELIAHYKLDETSGTVVHDASKYGNHGTLRDFGEDPWITDGMFGGGIHYTTTASTGAIVVPAAAQNAFDEHSFTISLWMRADENTYTPSANNAYLIHKGAFASAEGGKWYGIQLHHNGNINFSIDDDVVKTDASTNATNAGLFSGEWKHVVAVRDRDARKTRLYVDGELLSEVDDGTEGGIAMPEMDLTIGNSRENRPYRDDLDDVRLYNYALSGEEIAALFEGMADRELVAHYRLDETSGNVVTDSSPYSNHGVLRDFGEDPWISDGKRGGAIHYTTTAPTGAIVVPAAAQNAFDQNSFTISLWMRGNENTYTPSSNNAYLIHKGAFASAEGGKWYGIQLHHNGNINFSIDDDVVKTDAGTNANDAGLFSGEWKHVVAVRDRDARKTRLYIDGELKAETDDRTEGGIAMPEMELTIGNSRENRPYRDDLDDVRLYNCALTPEEIAKLFTPPREELQPVAHYKLDETSGTVAHDSSPHANHGTLRDFGGSPWIGDGKHGGAIHYTTTAPTGAIVVPAAAQNAFDQNSFTISLWMRGNENTYGPTSATNAYLIHKGAFASAEGGKWYGIQLHHNGNINFSIDDDVVKTDAGTNANDAGLFSGEWKHVVAVRDRDARKTRLYIDGELMAETDDRTEGGIAMPEMELTVGNSRENRPYRDDLDDVRLYNVALSPAQIKNLFESKPVMNPVQNVSPENGATDIPVSGTTFVWEGKAESYTLRLGTSPDDLAPVAEGITEQLYAHTSLLTHGTTYYWRVDALADGGVEYGETWSFQTEALALPVIHVDEVLGVNQYSPEGTVIAQLTASNPEGEVLTGWRITQNTDVNGNGVAAFALNAETGELTINDAGDFDYEEGRVLEVKVRVSNSLGESDEATIQVVVNFVNTQPSFDEIADVAYCFTPEERTITISGINAGLEEGQTVELSLSANPSRLFHTLSITQPEDGVAHLTYTPKAGIDDQVTVTVTAKDDGGTAHGGQDTYSQTFTLTIAAQPNISLLADKQRLQRGESVRLEVRNNARSAVALTWTYNDQTIETDVLTARLTETTTFAVKAVNEFGCEGEASITIEVFEPEALEVSNVVTPNGDGINDTWVVRNIEHYPGNELKIFDISGRVIHQAKDYRNDWNGTYQGRPLAEGTYYFVITFGGSRQPQKGYINIIRDNR